MLYTRSELESLPTLHSGHTCNMKIDYPDLRVWLCRDPNYPIITIERRNVDTGSWETRESYYDIDGEMCAA